MLPGPDIATDRKNDAPQTVPAAEPEALDDALLQELEEDDEAILTELNTAHLGRGVHARGDGEGGGMHVGSARLPGRIRTGAGLGELEIGDTRF